MNRRHLIESMLAACAVTATRAADAQAQTEVQAQEGVVDHSKYHEVKHEKVVLVAYPMMTALDLLGPQHMFASMMGATVLIAAQTREPVTSDTGLKITPDTDFESCPREADLLLVPGGLAGTTAAMKDPRMLDFIAEVGARSKYVTSVCTGSLILGAAGLLKGYRATSHWIAAHMLTEFGATPVAERVVFDRNRITGAGVTAGLDMALAVVKMLRGEEYTKMVALLAEYSPAPPVRAGSPREAGPKVANMLRDMYKDWIFETETIAKGSHHG
jgi:cyclohexyl-isocyanide hydratase